MASGLNRSRPLPPPPEISEEDVAAMLSDDEAPSPPRSRRLSRKSSAAATPAAKAAAQAVEDAHRPGYYTAGAALLSLTAVPVCYAINASPLVDQPLKLMLLGVGILVLVAFLAVFVVFRSIPLVQFDGFMVCCLRHSAI